LRRTPSIASTRCAFLGEQNSLAIYWEKGDHRGSSKRASTFLRREDVETTIFTISACKSEKTLKLFSSGDAMRILILLSALTGAKTFQLSGGLGIAPSAKSFLSNGVLHQSPRKACWPLCSSATETGTGAKLSKLETLKTESGYLTQPLDSEIRTEETLSVTPNAMQILKYHGR